VIAEGGGPGILPALTAWVTSNAFWIVAASVAWFLVSLLVIRVLIVRMPADYFSTGRRDSSQYRHPAAALGLRVAKNLLGAVVIVVGLVMSLPGVPGQGFLTLLIGLTLTDFPGKRKIELWILRRPLILRAINGLREQAGKAPLIIPGDGPDGTAVDGGRGAAGG